MKTSILLAAVALMSTGCFSAHAHPSPAVIVAPPPVQPAVVISPAGVSIQWHYMYVGTTWVRRSGPPPRGSTYHAHPRHRHSVVVHRPAASRGHRHTSHSRQHTHRRSTRR